MYNPVVGRWISRDPLAGANGGVEIVYTNEYVANRMRAVLKPYAYVTNNPINMIDPSGLVPVFDNSCTRDEQECIKLAVLRAERILKLIPQSVQANCPDNKPNTCKGNQLRDCIVNALSRVKIACADRGVGGCHKGKKNFGHTDTLCGMIKGLASVGVSLPSIPFPGFPGILHIFCNPCKHPLPFANDCSSCPDGFLRNAKTTLCRDQAPGGKSMADSCKTQKGVNCLAAKLVHEASHNCVGGHDTTGGKGKCDNCGRPDSHSIGDRFKLIVKC